MKLALGTAQFGLEYGVANAQGRLSFAGANEILNFSRDIGIDTLDTAIAYGESELTLGELGIEDFKVITKIPNITQEYLSSRFWISDQVKCSLSRLKVNKIEALLLHEPMQLIERHGQDIYNSLRRLKEDGLIKKFGISIYKPEEYSLISQFCDLDIVQCPFNIIDSRLQRTGLLDQLVKQQIEVHVRSVFLQGLLTFKRENIPSKFERWESVWDHWNDWLNRNSLSSIQACLNFVLSFPQIDKIIIGVDSKDQLNDIYTSYRKKEIGFFPDIFCEDENLINPSNWNKL